MVCTNSALTSGCVNPDGGQVGVRPSSGVTSTSVSLSAGTWYWAVRAIRAGDVGGWGAYSAVRSLSLTAVLTPPSAPPPSSPSDGASMTSGSINFVWGTSTNADRYHLMVCTNSALTSGCVNPDGGQVGVEPSSGVTSTSVSLSAGTWYWAVRAIRAGDVGGWGAYGAVRSLSPAGADPASAPPPSSPSDGASVTSGSINFVWARDQRGPHHPTGTNSHYLGCVDPWGQ
nr:hypothetical protein [Deltaproteobacteria bacterium]